MNSNIPMAAENSNMEGVISSSQGSSNQSASFDSSTGHGMVIDTVEQRPNGSDKMELRSASGKATINYDYSAYASGYYRRKKDKFGDLIPARNSKDFLVYCDNREKIIRKAIADMYAPWVFAKGPVAEDKRAECKKIAGIIWDDYHKELGGQRPPKNYPRGDKLGLCLAGGGTTNSSDPRKVFGGNPGPELFESQLKLIHTSFSLPLAFTTTPSLFLSNDSFFQVCPGASRLRTERNNL
ncbi:hypothetical protein CYLTODRAFT_409075 [Cylindrobasidium torrendii FP15055 ss-10]|uniref:Uncharacterized protein n=1 Tax=Cylindrobasidium torrendii FP15055 ss-10 TaxID=1314674 RepID=A0A0D7BJI8_9AGAR|nr:hypothetical protein CYLTODRAFT_409075 [Cylindrobasidium torrendii FP15055 ss-10]